MTDTTREAVERLEIALHSARPTQAVWVDPKDLAALLAAKEAAEAVVRKLVALNDDYSPFGGEILQDRVDRTWEEARAFLATFDQPKENNDVR